jgi:hypothetical protein
MEVIILGRGESLKKLDQFESDCNDVILVNEFWKSKTNPCDYYREPEISKFITGKDITLVCTPTMGDVSNLIKDIESDHNIKNKYYTVFAPGSGTDRDLPGNRNLYRLIRFLKNKYYTVFAPGSGTDRDLPNNRNFSAFPEECVEDFKYAQLSGELKNYDVYSGEWKPGCVRGSLAWAIILAINYYKADRVTIFGLDFYEKDYLVPQNMDYEQEKKQSQSIKNDFSLLFKFYNKVGFTIHTFSSYDPKLENVAIL